MKSLLAAVAVAAAVLAPAAYADCSYPPAPAHLPDGNTATLKQMLGGMKSVNEYNHQMEGYLACIKLERDSAVAHAGTKLTKQQKEILKQLSETIEIENTPASRGIFSKVKEMFS